MSNGDDDRQIVIKECAESGLGLGGQIDQWSIPPSQSKPTVVMDVNTQCVHIHQFSNISIESVQHHPLILLY